MITGPLNEVTLDLLREWDPTWARLIEKTTTLPGTSGVLPPKTAELIGLALNAACTNLNAEGTRRHIRTALEVGASRHEVLTVLKMASLLGIHTASLAAPLLFEEATAAGVKVAETDVVATPTSDKMRSTGQWNTAWDPFFNLDPTWTEAFMSAGVAIYSGDLDAKLAEFLSIAFDASYTHMYAPGTRRHIKAALALGATPEEIMAVLELCVVQGVQACNLGLPILAEELAERAKRDT